MKKYLLILVGLVITLIASTVFAYSPPAPEGYVMDMAGKLSAEQTSQLNSKLSNLNKTSKNEFAALILPSMNGENIEDVAQDTFRSWKVGKAGLDNGVLVVIAIAERKSRIQTGKGVEGDLTDIQSNDILLKHLNPHLKKGEFYEGLNETFDSISATVESRATSAPQQPSSTSSGATTGVIVGVLLLFGTIGFIIYYMVKKSKEEERRNNEMNSKLETLKYQGTYYRTDPLPYMVPPTIVPSRTIKPKKSASHSDYDSSPSSSSSSSSSSILDSFGSGSSGGDSGFGGFGGGSSGGGGSSSDW